MITNIERRVMESLIIIPDLEIHGFKDGEYAVREYDGYFAIGDICRAPLLMPSSSARIGNSSIPPMTRATATDRPVIVML